jgi:hypothetical protein
MIDDAGLPGLAGMLYLHKLHLPGSRITDGGLAHVGKVQQLVRLDVHGTDVGDAGLTHLAGMPSLKWLFLSETRVTDAGMESLGRLPQLCIVDLDGTAVADAGLRRLREHFPNDRLHVTVSATTVTEAAVEGIASEHFKIDRRHEYEFEQQ